MALQTAIVELEKSNLETKRSTHKKKIQRKALLYQLTTMQWGGKL
jgi:hypothetical protein